MKYLLFALNIVFFSFQCYAIEPLDDGALGEITAQDGITIVLDNFTITQPGGIFSIGGDDGLGIPAAPDGAWFVFNFDRTVQLDVEKGAFDIDVFTSPATGPYILGSHNYMFPNDKTAALITFGEAFFHVNNTEALYTLKFSNNPEGKETDGIVEFADTVCNFALNGSTITFRSDDAKMYIFSH